MTTTTPTSPGKESTMKTLSRTIVTRLAVVCVGLLALAGLLSAPALAAPAWTISSVHQSAFGATTLARQSGDNSYTITVTNSGDEAAGGSGAGAGQILTCTGGPAGGAVLSYQWLRNGAPVALATGRSYALTSADAGTAIQCEVMAVNAEGGSVAVSTAVLVTPVAATPPPTAIPPTISGNTTAAGTAAVGNTLTCNAGAWAPTFVYQWLRDGSPIGGQTAATYTVVSGDLDTSLQCQVVGTGPGGSQLALSARTVVLPTSPALGSPAPTITGTATVGSSLTCNNGTWTNSPTFAYQWLRNGAPISGAETSTYTLVSADESKAIQCQVTAINNEGAASAVTARLAVAPAPSPAPPSALGTISVTGARTVGTALTCAHGTWSPSATSYVFQWLRNGTPIPGTLAEPEGTQPTSTYRLMAADENRTIQCEVVAHNANGAAEALSTSAAALTQPGAPTATATAPAPPSVTAAVGLPKGIALAGSARSGGFFGAVNQIEAPGWSCDAVSLTCTRSDSLVAGASYPPITLHVHVNPEAADISTLVANVSGGGAVPPSATVNDPTVVTAAVPFGVNTFTTSVRDSLGEPFSQAGGHPFQASTEIVLNTTSGDNASLVNAGGDAKEVQAELPPGFLGNPQNVTQCPAIDLPPPGVESNGSGCPADSAVGYVAVAVGGTVTGGLNFASTNENSLVYNLVPTVGHPAQFGFNVAGLAFMLDGKLRSDGDYGVTVGTNASPSSPAIDGIRLTLCENGTVGAPPNATCAPVQPLAKPFLTNPTQCSSTAPSTTLETDSYQNPAEYASALSYPGAPSGHGPVPSSFLSGCEGLRFEPTLAVAPSTGPEGTTHAGQPTGMTVDLQVPQTNSPDALATPPLRDAVVTLPQGVAVNPSLAEGLQGCTDAQYGEHDGQPGNCPLSSKIGSLEVTTPLLDHKLPGNLYVRQPDPGATRANGLYTIFLEVDDPISGVIVKLRGSVVPDEKTGQLTATFKDNPQLPFSDLDLSFKGGPNGALVNPGACGSYTTQAQLTPWAGEGSAAATPTSSFTVDGCGSGGFHPGFEAGTSDTGAGHYSPFTLRVTRGDGEQNLSAIDATLPVGLTAKVAGVPLCGDAEASSGNCPAGSQIGSVIAGVGAGSNPLYVPQPGKAPTGVYLAGPYKGGPYSLVVKVPAQAGPFDLGTVAVRAAIYVDPETAQVSVKSDPLPQILEGVPIAYRDVRVKVDRNEFTLNPTSCNRMSVTGQIHSAAGSTAAVSSPFMVGGCEKLDFGPKLKLQLKGATGRIGHPALKAVVTAGPGEANIATAQVNLPHGEFLDQGNLNKTCTKPVLMAGACPASTVYGHARAWTPLLDKPLEGNVYLVGGYGYKLPALVAELNGQIKVLLVGKVDSGSNKGIRNTFEMVPDAPVSRFELSMKGGKKYGLLQNSENLCTASKQERQANVFFNGQNGKVEQLKSLVANQCGKVKAKPKKQSKHH
jgi:hypothetical protein